MNHRSEYDVNDMRFALLSPEAREFHMYIYTYIYIKSLIYFISKSQNVLTGVDPSPLPCLLSTDV